MAKTKRIEQTTTIASALQDTASEIVELKNEMESWRDGMPDSLQSSDKYSMIEEACDALEAADQLEEYANTIGDKLTLLAEGRAAVTPCPKHAAGMPCIACGWDGVGKVDPRARPVRTVYEKAIPMGADPRATMVVGRIGHPTNTTFGFEISGKRSAWAQNRSNTVKISANEEDARKAMATFIADLEAKTPLIIPKERAEVTALAPFEAAKNLPNLTIVQSQAHKGKSLSRADRLSNALGMGSAGLEALTNWLKETDTVIIKINSPEAKDDEHAALLNDIQDALDEYESALNELEGVEFPGMFG